MPAPSITTRPRSGLREQIWPADKRITVEVLVGNRVAREFYGTVGFRPYCMELEMPPAAETA